MIGLGLLAAFIVLLIAIDRLSPAPEGPPSSSYATTPQGLAAYASVLRRSGHPVRQVRTRIADEAPPSDQTLVVLDPDVMEPEEARAIGAWVRAGGNLVAGGTGEAPWLDQVLADPPRWKSGDTRLRRTLVPAGVTTDVDAVVSTGGGWHELGRALPVIGPADGPLLVTTRSWLRCSPKRKLDASGLVPR